MSSYQFNFKTVKVKLRIKFPRLKFNGSKGLEYNKFNNVGICICCSNDIDM